MDVKTGYQCQKTSNINITHKIMKFEMPFIKFTTVYMSFILNTKLLPHSSHRVEIATFNGVHSIMMQKLAQPGEGEGYTPYPFTILPSRTKFWCTFQLKGQIHSPYFYSTRICTLCLLP